MFDRKTSTSPLFFPEDLSISDGNCVVCMDDARKPVFCTTCKKMLCFECMKKCQRENGCAICRTKAPEQVFQDQSEAYHCEAHDLLLTMLCTTCNVCVCKLCLGKGADHSCHAFVTIDDIRMELGKEMDSIYEYFRIIDGFKEIESSSATNLSTDCRGHFLRNVKTLSGVLQSVHGKIETFVKEVETYRLKDLITQRVQIKIQLQEALDDIASVKEQEAQEIYDFDNFPLRLRILNIWHVLCSKIIDDRFGNRWQLNVYPRYAWLFISVKHVEFKLTLLSGTPGRYEVKIDGDRLIHFQKVLEFMDTPSTRSVYTLDSKLNQVSEISLSLSLRPANFKYHMQCSQLFREMANNSIPKPYFERTIVIKRAEVISTNNHFIRDGTGTLWRIKFNVYNHKICYLSACIEHYDGAVGKFDFFIQITNFTNEFQSVKHCISKKFRFGSEYIVNKFVPASEIRNNYVDNQDAIHLKIGIRPAVDTQSRLLP